MNNVDYHNDYRDFSEIDYLLGSNLAETPVGLSKAMQRLPLFDLSKRHIPYLLLIHKVLYNNDYPEADKKEAINKLLAGLYREVIHKNSRKQLSEHFPSYFVYRLLVDLYIAGYKIELVLRGVKDESDAIDEIQKYGDFSAGGFPQFLWTDLAKYKHLGKYRGEVLHAIALKSLFAGNMAGFFHLLGLMKEYKLSSPGFIGAIANLVYRNEIDQAIKIAESEPRIEWVSTCFLELGITLAKTNKIDVLNNLKQSISKPELRIGILGGLMTYYFERNEFEVADKLLDEAFSCLIKIKSNYIRILRLTWILVFIRRTGDSSRFEDCIKEILLLEHKIQKKQKHIVRVYFCLMLFQNGLLEKAMEYARQWQFQDTVKYDFYSDFFLQGMVKHELDSCDFKLRRDRILSAGKLNENAMHYYKIALETADLIQESIYKDEILHQIAERMAIQGFYNEAIKVRDSFIEDIFQSDINSSMPMIAIANGDVSEALHFVEMIGDEKIRLAVQLCMTPHLEKLNYKKEAAKFMREWANYTFKNS